jgi:outer membrane protein OmpA-like peptidoglycan-associated protein
MKHTRSRAALLRRLSAMIVALAAPGARGQSARDVTDPTDDTSVRGVERLALRLEASGGTMLPEHQRRVLGYDAGHLQLHGRLAVSVLDALSLQVSAGHGRFFSSRASLEPGLTLSVTAGARLEPRVGRAGRLWLDANGGYILTGDDRRFGLDAGVGFELRAARWLGVGPFVRYHHITQNPQDPFPQDAIFWSAGLALTLRVPSAPPAQRVQPEPPPIDTDMDGLLDPDDRCPRTPRGAHPDPSRPGCPGIDRDADGIFEPQDRCPEQAQGPHPDPARTGCPDDDDDRDAVFNSADVCRQVPAGAHPDPSRAGCPLPDRDGDSVPDATDHCPDQPGAPSREPDRNGCPGLVRVQNGMIQILAPVYFASNRDTILHRSFPVLDAVTDAIRSSPEMRRIVVEGHTDDVGDAQANMTLSQRRAWSVVEFIHERGVEASRLRAAGFGESRPVRAVEGLRGAALREARAQNRRVDFRIVSE